MGPPMNGDAPVHVCVCIPTYRRPAMLQRLLVKLQSQVTENCFDYSIVVVDNDGDQSSRAVVDTFRASSHITVCYAVAAEKNVAVARNTAVQAARGDFIAFIDDDELPEDTWLIKLWQTQRQTDADAVLGPVKAVFDEAPPDWIVRAGVFNRPSHPTGTVLHWQETRTGNVLLRRSIFDDPRNLFDTQFKHSEDKDFFRRLSTNSGVFVWCDEAPVYETEPAERFRIKYFLRRALVRGNAAMRHNQFAPKAIVKSLTALLVYPCALPFLLLFRRHLFILYTIKICDHLGGIAAVAGVDLVGYFGHA